MRKNNLVWIISLFLTFSSPAHADGYAPGTVGYLYEDCVSATQAENVDDFVGSYCARFFNGYVRGYMRANWIVPVKNAKDPCHAEMQRHYDHIKGRFCGSGILDRPPYATKEPLLSVMHLFFGWVDFLKEDGQDKVLNKQASAAFNDMIRPGPYCDVIAGFDGNLSRYALSKAVHKVRNNPGALKAAYERQIVRGAQEQCDGDTSAPDSFRASRCGAEVAGYIAGINSTKWIQDNRLEAEDTACQPGVTRFYNSLDIPAYTCLRPDTDPVRVALAYLALPTQRDAPLSAGEALGFVNMCPKKD